MRAYEFLENREPPSKPITLRGLHKMKLEQKRHQAAEIERHNLMRIMYSQQPSEQEQIDLEKQQLELAQLRADINATNVETAFKSAIALHSSAQSGIDSKTKNQQKFNKTIKSALGRDLKP